MENFDSLKRIILGGRVNEAEFLLPASRLDSADINAVADTYLENGALSLRNYRLAESEQDQSVTIVGTGADGLFAGMDVEAMFRLRGTEPTLRITATAAPDWNFGNSFPLLKGSLAAGIRFASPPTFTLASYDLSNTIEQNSLHFQGRTSTRSVLEGLSLFLGDGGPTISGTIVLVKGAPKMTLSTPPLAEVDLGLPHPVGLVLDVCSVPVMTGAEDELLPDTDVFLRLRTDIPFTAQGKEYSIPLAAVIYDPTTRIVFSIDLESFTEFVAAGAAELARLVNGVAFADQLPAVGGLQLAEIITLKNLFFYFDPSSSTKLTAVALSIESRKSWQILHFFSPSGQPVTISLESLSLVVSLPMDTRKPAFSVAGILKADGGGILLSLNTPELTVAGDLLPGTEISLRKAVTLFTGLQLNELPEITVADFSFYLQPGTGEFGINGTLASNWEIPVGNLTTFALTSVNVALNRSAGAGISGSVGGSATLGGAVFNASYSFPGNNFVLGGKIPSVRIGSLIGDLCNNSIALPQELDFSLKDSEFAVTKSGSDYVFHLQTELPEVGTLFFQIQRTLATGWGAAVGVDLSVVRRIGDLPGFGFLNALDLTFTRMALVLSSVDLPAGYTFPELPTYKGTAPAGTGRVQIPNGIGSPKQGINFYAQFAFGDRAATRDESLLKLYEFFSLERVLLDVAVQVSYKGGSLSALMLAGVAVDGTTYGIGGGNVQYNMGLAAYLAIQFGSDGNAAIFLRGLLKLSEPATTTGRKLTFAVELGLQPNGFYVAGSMTGTWTNPFGIQGISVSDAGIMVGVNWQGVPSVGFAGTLTVTGFQGSLACILNSQNPANSVLAGGLSNLSLGDVVHTFVGLLGEPDPAAKEVISLLKNIAVEGINSFTLPATLADAFDAQDLKTIAAAFAQHANITLIPTPESTMFVPDVVGERWFVTDKTNGITHYQITREGETLVARQQAQLYFSPSNARIGLLDFPEGYRIYGRLDIFGFKQQTDVSISISRGIGAEVRMSKINLFGGLLRVERAPGDTRSDGRGSTSPDGPYLSIATYPRPPYNTPHVYISGSLSFLGLVHQVMDIEVSEKGIHVLVERTLLGTHFNFSFDFKASPLYLAGNGTAGLRLNPKIDLSGFGLGTYNIADVDFLANLSFSASGQKLNAHASGNFYFSIPQFNVKLGPYSLDVDLVTVDQPLAKLQHLLETAVQGIGNLAQDLANRLLSDAKNFAELVKSGIVTIAGSLDSVLKQIFNVSLADLYATTQCFAGTRLAPRMMRPLSPTPAYNTPIPGQEFPGSAAPQDDPLARLRELRDDLGDSPTGQWVLNIYNTLSEPLVHLYDFRPADPNDPTFDQVLTAYDGYQVYNDLLKLLKTAGTAQPFNVTGEFLSKGMSLVSGIIDLAEFYSQTGDPQREREGKLIIKGISGLLNQVSLLQQFQGLNYQQIKEKVRTMDPPPSPFI